MSSDMRGMVPLSVSYRASLSFLLLNIQNVRLFFLFRYAIKHQSVKSNGYPFTRSTFSRHEYDLVWNRDYSLRDGMFRLNTLSGRLKVPFESKGMEHWLSCEGRFGTAKLLCKNRKWFLHVPVTLEKARSIPAVRSSRNGRTCWPFGKVFRPVEPNPLNGSLKSFGRENPVM